MKTIKLLLLLACLSTLSGCKKDRVFSKNDKVTPHDFLANDKYEKLVIEVQYVNGYKPTPEAMANLVALLQKRLNKSKGIIISERSISSPGKSHYSTEDIRSIEKSNRTENTKGSTLTAYLLFIDGEYAGNAGNSKVLGIAYAHSSMAIFEKSIQDYSGGIGEPPTYVLETAVANHEFGHILGLVNNGTSLTTSHQDTNSGHHCSNQNCLMYYLVETSDIVANLLGNTIPDFDSNCLSDLQANGGK